MTDPLSLLQQEANRMDSVIVFTAVIQPHMPITSAAKQIPFKDTKLATVDIIENSLHYQARTLIHLLNNPTDIS